MDLRQQDISRNASRLAAASIAVAAAVMGIKYFAYLLTGSVALFSDALESIVNVMTAVVALVALRIGARPPDKNHPFGHQKAEFFAAIFEGAMIVVAALLILVKAAAALREGVTLESPGQACSSTPLPRSQCGLGVTAHQPWAHMAFAGS